MKNELQTPAPIAPPEAGLLDLEATFRQQLSSIQTRSDDEIEAQRADEKKQRVAQLRREACLPRRANAFCKAMEQRGPLEAGAENWWGYGSPWAQCMDRIVSVAGAGATVAVLGPQGRGKTTLAVALARRFTFEERSVRWCDVVGFILAMQDAKSGGYQQREFREWEAPDLLVIDQADKMPAAEWESRLLFRLLDQRYNALKTTLLLCNVENGDPEAWAREVAGKLGASIWDRIRETGIVELTAWPALRQDLDAGKGGQ
jgi:DNA replication protein DnaC